RPRLSGLRSRLAGGVRHRVLFLDRGGRLGPRPSARDPHPRLRLQLARGGHPGAHPVAAPCLSGADRRVSDYLANLAARSLEPAQAVRPRLASRFEPVPSALSPFQAEPAAPFETAVEETAVTPVPTRTSRPAPAPQERAAPPEPVEEEPSAPP